MYVITISYVIIQLMDIKHFIEYIAIREDYNFI